jgi:hypothetical protein
MTVKPEGKSRCDRDIRDLTIFVLQQADFHTIFSWRQYELSNSNLTWLIAEISRERANTYTGTYGIRMPDALMKGCDAMGKIYLRCLAINLHAADANLG